MFTDVQFTHGTASYTKKSNAEIHVLVTSRGMCSAGDPKEWHSHPSIQGFKIARMSVELVCLLCSLLIRESDNTQRFDLRCDSAFQALFLVFDDERKPLAIWSWFEGHVRTTD